MRLPTALGMIACCSVQQHSRGLFKHKLQIAYNGTSYQGFQVQRHLSHKDTVQGELERVWSQLFQEDPVVMAMQAAGRTDSGVHAKGQVFASRMRESLQTCNVDTTQFKCELTMNCRGVSCENLGCMIMTWGSQSVTFKCVTLWLAVPKGPALLRHTSNVDTDMLIALRSLLKSILFR